MLTDFLNKLKSKKEFLTKQQLRTLKGQALSGNISGAEKGLQKLLKKRCG